MEREAQKENEDRLRRKDGDRLLGQLARVSGLNNTTKSGSAEVSVSGDVVIGRHPVSDELSERPPNTDVQQGQGYHLRGSKRYVPGEIFSPSKRRRDSNRHEDQFKTRIENPVCDSKTGWNIKGAAKTEIVIVIGCTKAHTP